jgi:hypothetical protein
MRPDAQAPHKPMADFSVIDPEGFGLISGRSFRLLHQSDITG